MKIWSESFEDGQPIPARCALGVHDPESHVRFSDDRNPHLAWTDVPEGTRSFVLLCHDRDAPTKPDDVNQEGKRVPAELPRTDFFHWVLIDLLGSIRSVAEAEHSDALTTKGKPGPEGPGSARHGLNDYTGWFAGDPDMAGQYFGYDGPCPPWNDTIVHHYVFTLYALDVPRLPLEGAFTGPEVRKVIEGHVLAEAALVGTYTVAPDAVDRG